MVNRDVHLAVTVTQNLQIRQILSLYCGDTCRVIVENGHRERSTFIILPTGCDHGDALKKYLRTLLSFGQWETSFY